MSFYNSPETLAACRTYEKKFPMVPEKGWTRYKQYSTPDVLRKSIQTFWGFGVSKEIRFEEGVRKDNRSVKIHTWDPSPISLDTIAVANRRGANVIHTMRAYDPSEKPMQFYTTDHKKRCWSLENHDPVNLVDTITVETENLKSITKRLGNQVDIMKFDIEGRWFEMCQEIIELDLPVSMIHAEFEMYFEPIDIAKDKLDKVIEQMKNKGLAVLVNRVLQGPHVELCFYKNE
jgi:hypothetical protein